MRDKLIKLLFGTALHWSYEYGDEDFRKDAERTVDYLIAHGVTVQEWIPVSERLPECNSRVIACGTRGGVYLLRMESETEPWGKIDGTTKYRLFTHWMPLPEAPKEVEDVRKH